MPNLGMLQTLFKVLPVVVQTVQAVRARPRVDHDGEEMREELADFKKQVNQQLTDADTDRARMKARIRELETSTAFNTILIYMALALGAAGFILGLLALTLRR